MEQQVAGIPALRSLVLLTVSHDHSWALHNTLQPTITYFPPGNIKAILNTCDRVSPASITFFLTTTANFPFDALLTPGALTEIFPTLILHNPADLAGQQQYLVDAATVLLNHPLLFLVPSRTLKPTA